MHKDDTVKQMEQMNVLLKQLNKMLGVEGKIELAVVNPKDCIPQKKNARYFPAEKFKQLVKNIQRDGVLESLPLLHARPDGKYDIISGHHRIDAAKEVKIEKILVLVRFNLSTDEVVSKQLSHNALTGLDDRMVLSELFQSIKDIELKLATGLNDEASKISYESLNFRIGNFKEFSILFLPDDEQMFDAVMEKIAGDMILKARASVRTTSVAYYDRFAKAIRKIKKVENIKSNGTALMRMVELASLKMDEMRQAEMEVLEANAGKKK